MSAKTNEESKMKGVKSAQKRSGEKGKNFTGKEISLFCSQLAMMLRSGISLYDGLEAMCEDSDDLRERTQVLAELSAKLKEGGTLADSLAGSEAFPRYMVNMVEIGERSGRLEEVMTSLSAFYNREDRLKQQIRSAVVYPALLVGMMTVVILVLVVRVLPVFEQVFRGLGTQMSPLASGILHFGMAASRWAVGIIAVLVVLIVILLILSRSRKKSGKGELFSGLARLPGLRTISEKISAGRFASALSLMLSSGYDVQRALELIPSILPGSRIKAKVVEIRRLVQEGETLSDAIRKAKIFPGLYSKMVAVGFKTGTVDEVMGELAEMYEEEIDNSLNNLVAILEPVLVAVLSLVIGVILLSVMMPLMGIMSSIG